MQTAQQHEETYAEPDLAPCQFVEEGLETLPEVLQDLLAQRRRSVCRHTILHACRGVMKESKESGIIGDFERLLGNAAQTTG